jgi:hypothetical protein
MELDVVEIKTPTYSALQFLVRYGNWLVVVTALMPILCGVWAWLAGMSPIFAIGGLIGAAFLYLIMRSYVELVRVIVDMLLPK